MIYHPVGGINGGGAAGPFLIAGVVPFRKKRYLLYCWSTSCDVDIHTVKLELHKGQTSSSSDLTLNDLVLPAVLQRECVGVVLSIAGTAVICSLSTDF